MTEPITYRPLTKTDAPAFSLLILDAFNEFIAAEYSEEGRTEFGRYVAPDALVERSRSSPHTILLALVGDTPAGVIELRDDDPVPLLFVDAQYQHRGIARALLTGAIAIARPSKPGLERVTVNSSRFGVPAYERLGFRQTGPERTVNGILFIPMAHRLEADPG